MRSALGWMIAFAISIVVGAAAETWSFEARFWLALLVVGVPYLIADAERRRP